MGLRRKFMAYQRNVTIRQVLEEDIDIANSNIKISLRSSGKYEFKKLLFNNTLASCQKLSEGVKYNGCRKMNTFIMLVQSGKSFFQDYLIVVFSFLKCVYYCGPRNVIFRNFSYKNTHSHIHRDVCTKIFTIFFK